MLRKVNLNRRFGLLILIPALALLLVGGFSGLSTLSSSQEIDTLLQQQQRRQPLLPLSDLIDLELTRITYAVTLNQLGWEAALEQLSDLHDRFELHWQRYLDMLPAAERTAMESRYRTPLVDLRRTFSELSRLLENRDRPHLHLFVVNEFDALTQPYLQTIGDQLDQKQSATTDHYQTLHTAQQRRTWISWTLSLLSIGLVVSVGWVARQSMMQPITRIVSVARSVAVGDYSVRVGFSGRDELGKLGQALDQLLDEQNNHLAQSKEERSRLQLAMDTLQQHLQSLEQGDLNTRLPTDDEITRTLALSINRAIERLATTWGSLNQLAEQIDQQEQAQHARTDHSPENHNPPEINELYELSSDIETALKRTTKLSQACCTVALRAQHSTEAALQALQPLTTTEASVRLERIVQQSLGELQTQTTAIQTLVADFSEAAEQAQMLAINADLQYGFDERHAAMVSDLKSLVRALRRTQQLLMPLSERVHGETGRLLQNADLNNQSRSSEQLLVHSAELNTQAKQLQKALQEQVSQSATLADYVQRLQQLAASPKAGSPSDQLPDSHAPLPMKPT